MAIESGWVLALLFFVTSNISCLGVFVGIYLADFQIRRSVFRRALFTLALITNGAILLVIATTAYYRGGWDSFHRNPNVTLGELEFVAWWHIACLIVGVVTYLGCPKGRVYYGP